MTDTSKPGDKTLSVSSPSKTLSLAGKPGGGPTTVRQNFSHGRSKAVVVEVAKKRTISPPGARPAAPAPAAPAAVPAPQAAAPRPATTAREAAAPRPTLPPPLPTPPMPPKQAAQAPVARAAAPAPAEKVAAPVATPSPVAPAPVAPAAVEAAAPPPSAAASTAAPPASPAAPPAAPLAAARPAATPSAPVRTGPSGAPITRTGPSGAPITRTGPSGAPITRTGPSGAPITRAPAGGSGGRPGQRPGSSAGTPQRGTAATPAGQPQGGSRPGANKPGGMVLRTLSEEEKQMRGRILADAKAREEDDRRRAVEEGRRRQELEEIQRREREAAEQRRRDEEERHRRDQEAKARAEAEAKRRLGEEAAPAAGARTAAGRAGTTLTARPGTVAPAAPGTAARPGLRRPGAEEEDDRRSARPGFRRPGAPPVAPRPEKRDAARRPSRPLTVSNALNEPDDRARSVAAMRRRVQRNQRRAAGGEAREKIMREVVIPETITIQELANRMSERAVDLIRLLMRQGAMHKITDVIDADTAQLLAEEFGHTVKRVSDSDVEEGLFTDADAVDDMLPRPAVVTIMGHVDHGKTSLLDAIRKTNVVSGEAGGITQHIGAYQVSAPDGGKITFIDTPGHAAFTAMRARGARVTDLVILVVAANDGVMPQTVEAIQHAKAARVPMIVAINKIDLPDANPTRVRTDLLQHDVQVESMGGDTLEVEVSAKTGAGLDRLLEAIQLQSEVLDLKANPDRPAEAIVVEAKLDKGRGPVASVIVQRGTLRVGDIVVAGSAWGRVRALLSDVGAAVTEAGPAQPVEILGFDGVPEAGDRLAAVENDSRAREIADYRERKRREKQQARMAGARTSLSDMMSQLKAGTGRKELTLVVKGDVQGSVEAISQAVEKLGNEEVGARIVLSGVGGITESDVTLSATTRSVIIGFNVRASREAREAAERDGIEIRYYNIIYDLVDDVKQAMTGLLPPTYREEMLGNALILEVFNITKVGKIAGCRITDGKVERGAGVRLIRDNVVVHEGRLSQLKRFKDDAREVTSGQECGMAFEGYQDMRQGDTIECYRTVEVARTL